MVRYFHWLVPRDVSAVDTPFAGWAIKTAQTDWQAVSFNPASVPIGLGRNLIRAQSGMVEPEGWCRWRQRGWSRVSGTISVCQPYPFSIQSQEILGRANGMLSQGFEPEIRSR